MDPPDDGETAATQPVNVDGNFRRRAVCDDGASTGRIWLPSGPREPVPCPSSGIPCVIAALCLCPLVDDAPFGVYRHHRPVESDNRGPIVKETVCRNPSSMSFIGIFSSHISFFHA